MLLQMEHTMVTMATCTTTYGGLCLVVASNVPVQRAEEDHSDHGREEDGDEDRVDEREPLDVGLRHGAQNVVPAGGPTDVLHLLCVATDHECILLC